ncbi:hypothetical protein AB0O34_36365, partial [Sphaerisporangium sp. NPDC088356]|uniref:hypothetical protein n=1 Tax=Sphaerisporangium sp. NPDC088356 TaxID=3154871 RepID=UPI003423BF65
MLVAFGGFGVVADREPFGVGDPHLLDPHVPGDLAVAALPGQGGLHLRAAAAEFLSDDVGAISLAEVAAVAFAGESPAGDPRDLAQGPVTHIVLDLPDQLLVTG